MNLLFNLSAPSVDIVKGYILLEALLNNLYSFFCNSCGYYPWILVMDLNKKIAFKCAFEELEDGEEPGTPWTATNSGRMSNLMLSQMLFLIEKLKG